MSAPDTTAANRHRPRCPKCRSVSLTLAEEHLGTGSWGSDEWHVEDDGTIVMTGDGWAGSSPTGRWFFECEDCGHGWRKRSPTNVGSA